MELLIVIDGAGTHEIARGVAAAQAVFDMASVSAWEAAAAQFKEWSELEELTLAEARAARVWDEAEAAALEACCVGWSVKPDNACLELHWRQEDLGHPAGGVYGAVRQGDGSPSSP